jgi:hypothetical protein
MRKSDARPGGVFLALGILVGLGWGIADGRPLIGALAGTAAGLSIVLLLWVLDLRRR